MTGEILDAVLNEIQALLEGTGAMVMLKTNFKPGKAPDNTGNFVLLGLPDAEETFQYPGGLTRVDWQWALNSYNYEPDAMHDDKSGYSTSLLNFIDTVRRHFSIGARGNGVTNSSGTLRDGIIYQVAGGSIVYNNVTLLNGTYFAAADPVLTFTTADGGYVLGTSWLTQGMVTIFNNYGFQFTLSGITAAEPMDEDGIIMGFKIVFSSTALDDQTLFTGEAPLISVTQVDNPPFDGSGVAVDESFEPLTFETIGFYPNSSPSAILNVNWDILRPNLSVTLIQDSFIELNNTTNGASGQIEVTLTTGNEGIQLNGANNFIKPTIPGSFLINYLNINGNLIFS